MPPSTMSHRRFRGLAFESTVGKKATSFDHLESKDTHDPLLDQEMSFMDRAKRSAGAWLGSGAKEASWKEKVGKSLGSDSQSKAASALLEMSLSQVLTHHRDLFRWFAKTEYSTENLDFYEDIEAGMSAGALAAKYIDTDKNVNIKHKTRLDLLAGILDPPELKLEAFDVMRDTFGRFRENPEVIKRLAARLG